MKIYNIIIYQLIMSFTRTQYDAGAYQIAVNQSAFPGTCKICNPGIMIEPCYPYAPTVRAQKMGVATYKDKHLIDVDSELIGITRKFSREPAKKYLPACIDSVCSSGEVCGQGVTGNCTNSSHNVSNATLSAGLRPGDDTLLKLNNCFRPRVDCRLINPPSTLRGHGWNRWETLCKNPQAKIFEPFAISNRLLVKDNHKTIYPIPLDQCTIRPIGPQTLPCEPLDQRGICANFTLPKSVQWV